MMRSRPRTRITAIHILLSSFLSVWAAFSLQPSARAADNSPVLAWIAEPSASAESGPAGRLASYFACRFPRHLIQGARKSFSLKNMVFLALAGGAAGALLTVDDDIREFFRNERPIGRSAEDTGATLGSPEVLFGLSGAAFLLGEFSENPRIRAVGETALESLSIAGVPAALLKVATRRERPDGGNRLSFPSFHAAGSFAIAASLHNPFGWEASLPAFLTAAFISVARVQEDKHFLSDTLFGAVLGTVVGLAVGKLHREGRLRVLADIDRDEAAVRLAFRY